MALLVVRRLSPLEDGRCSENTAPDGLSVLSPSVPRAVAKEPWLLGKQPRGPKMNVGVKSRQNDYWTLSTPSYLRF